MMTAKGGGVPAAPLDTHQGQGQPESWQCVMLGHALLWSWLLLVHAKSCVEESSAPEILLCL